MLNGDFYFKLNKLFDDNIELFNEIIKYNFETELYKQIDDVPIGNIKLLFKNMGKCRFLTIIITINGNEIKKVKDISDYIYFSDIIINLDKMNFEINGLKVSLYIKVNDKINEEISPEIIILTYISTIKK